MTEGHRIILNFLQSLRHAKGPEGSVGLAARHGLPQTAEHSRGVIATRGFTAPGLRPAEEPAPAVPDPTHVQEDGSKVRGSLKVGEVVLFHGVAPRTGFIHLFNLGTSGTCTKLAPSKEYPDNRVMAGSEFKLPSATLFAADLLPDEGFSVNAPASAEHGQPERLLVIVTRDDTDLQIEDLHPKMVGRDALSRCATRGPGFSGPAQSGEPKLFRIPSDRWDYGLLEMEVVV